MNSIEFYPAAKEELLDAIQYYEDCQPGLVNIFRSSIETATQHILSSPLTYRVVRPPFRRYLLSQFPYSIFYSIEPSHILILAIAHNKRRPNYWSERKS